MIDSITNKVTTTIHMDSSPYALAFNPKMNKLYVANYNDGKVSVIDGITNKVDNNTLTTTGFPNSLAVNPITNMIYVTNTKYNTVNVVSA